MYVTTIDMIVDDRTKVTIEKKFDTAEQAYAFLRFSEKTKHPEMYGVMRMFNDGTLMHEWLPVKFSKEDM